MWTVQPARASWINRWWWPQSRTALASDVAPPSAQELAQVAQQLVRVERQLALRVRAAGLDQVRHRVDPEPVDAQLQPEPDDLGDLVAHRRVGDVEVGLM